MFVNGPLADVCMAYEIKPGFTVRLLFVYLFVCLFVLFDCSFISLLICFFVFVFVFCFVFLFLFFCSVLFCLLSRQPGFVVPYFLFTNFLHGKEFGKKCYVVVIFISKLTAHNWQK